MNNPHIYIYIYIYIYVCVCVCLFVCVCVCVCLRYASTGTGTSFIYIYIYIYIYTHTHTHTYTHTYIYIYIYKQIRHILPGVWHRQNAIDFITKCEYIPKGDICNYHKECERLKIQLSEGTDFTSLQTICILFVTTAHYFSWNKCSELTEYETT